MWCTRRFYWPTESLSPSFQQWWLEFKVDYELWLRACAKWKPLSTPRAGQRLIRREGQEWRPLTPWSSSHICIWWLGMLCTALRDHGGASVCGVCSFCAEAGEFELVLLLHMFYVRKYILNALNYHLDRCFPEIADAAYGDKFADLAGLDDFTRLPSGVF